MKRLDLNNLSSAELDRMGGEAETVNYQNTRPLTREFRRALAGATAKGGRPRVGAGAKRINITVERRLLNKTDAYARQHGLTRAAVVAEGLKKIVAA